MSHVRVTPERSSLGAAPQERRCESPASSSRRTSAVGHHSPRVSHICTAVSGDSNTAPGRATPGSLTIATDAGAAGRHSLGTAVFGGMLVSTFLNLVVVPVFYVVIERLRERLIGESPAPETRSETPFV